MTEINVDYDIAEMAMQSPQKFVPAVTAFCATDGPPLTSATYAHIVARLSGSDGLPPAKWIGEWYQAGDVLGRLVCTGDDLVGSAGAIFDLVATGNSQQPAGPFAGVPISMHSPFNLPFPINGCDGDIFIDVLERHGAPIIVHFHIQQLLMVIPANATDCDPTNDRIIVRSDQLRKFVDLMRRYPQLYVEFNAFRPFPMLIPKKYLDIDPNYFEGLNPPNPDAVDFLKMGYSLDSSNPNRL